jgi:hypothetical protein
MDCHHLLSDFLVQGNGQADFVPWLLGESYQLNPWADQACLRNVVAHGALSSTKAQQWGLAHVYDDAVVVFPILFRRLLAATLGSAEVIHG